MDIPDEVSQTATTWVRPTPTGWLAGSTVFPRIAVVGASASEARQQLEARCAWWRALPVSEEDQEYEKRRLHEARLRDDVAMVLADGITSHRTIKARYGWGSKRAMQALQAARAARRESKTTEQADDNVSAES